MNKTTEAYPLSWPAGRPRTKYPESSRLRSSFAKARDSIVREIRLLGGIHIIISTNIQLRKDGLPYSAVREPEDAGVAVYFTYKSKQVCFACDRWHKIAENMQAIKKTIEALRGIARWGTGDMMDSAFTGFTALQSPFKGSVILWRKMFVFSEKSTPTLKEVEREYKKLRSICHPDKGGSAEEFNAVQEAWEQAQQELKTNAPRREL